MKNKIYKSIAVLALALSFVVARPVGAEEFSFEKFVNLLISIGVIAEDKIPAAQELLKSFNSDLIINKFKLNANQLSANTYSYLIEAQPNIDRLSINLNCDREVVKIISNNKLSCGNILNLNFIKTKNFTLPKVTYSSLGDKNNQPMATITVTGYLGEKKIGQDSQTITIK